MRKPTSTRNKTASPLRLNLNLRIKRGKEWTHYQGLSFICEATNHEQAALYGQHLKAAAQQIAVQMGLTIPGATIIYVPKAADHGTTESTTPANQAETRA